MAKSWGIRARTNTLSNKVITNTHTHTHIMHAHTLIHTFIINFDYADSCKRPGYISYLKGSSLILRIKLLFFD